MVIGIDLRPLQTGDKYRGIGEVVKQTTSRILALASRESNHDVRFVFYEYDNGDDPKKLIDIPKGLVYKVCLQDPPPADGERSLRRAKSELKLFYGRPIKGASQCDVFLQFNYALGIPGGTRAVLVKHDIIPYIFWDQNFGSTLKHILRRKPRTALRTAYKNYRYMRPLRRALKRAGVILTVSSHTREDLKKHFRVKDKKMKTAQLGVSMDPAKTHIKSKLELPEKPYLLFFGGIDGRRRAVDDLVAAYNSLKADGHDIQLVLAGENFPSPEGIPGEAVRSAVMSSSYREDIVTAGYIDDATKQSLLRGALAFVFPTRYEGFGIPVLESMLMECPVIAYKNSAVPEVGGKHVLYADGWQGIKAQAERLLKMPAKERQKLIAEAKAHAQNFTWDKTAAAIYEELINKS